MSIVHMNYWAKKLVLYFFFRLIHKRVTECRWIWIRSAAFFEPTAFISTVNMFVSIREEAAACLTFLLDLLFWICLPFSVTAPSTTSTCCSIVNDAVADGMNARGFFGEGSRRVWLLLQKCTSANKVGQLVYIYEILRGFSVNFRHIYYANRSILFVLFVSSCLSSTKVFKFSCVESATARSFFRHECRWILV